MRHFKLQLAQCRRGQDARHGARLMRHFTQIATPSFTQSVRLGSQALDSSNCELFSGSGCDWLTGSESRTAFRANVRKPV